MSYISANLTEEELRTAIEGILFSCSVNVVSCTDSDHQTKLFELAKKLKSLKQDIKLDSISFIKEENYEDEYSTKILSEFGSNVNITTFEHV